MHTSCYIAAVYLCYSPRALRFPYFMVYCFRSLSQSIYVSLHVPLMNDDYHNPNSSNYIVNLGVKTGITSGTQNPTSSNYIVDLGAKAGITHMQMIAEAAFGAR